jgi:tetratricopeptide (TPR) repeat protein
MHLSNIGVVHAQLGQLGAAIEKFEESLVIYRKSGSRDGLAQGLNHVGLVHRDLGDLDHAHAELTESIAIYREVGDRHGEAYGLSGLVDVLAQTGRYAEAAETAQVQHALALQIGDLRAIATGLNCLGAVSYGLGRYRESIERHRESYQVAVEVGDLQGDLEANLGIARAHLRLGDIDAALAHAVPALERARDSGYLVIEGQLLNILADAYVTAGRWDEAADHAASAIDVHRITGARAYLVDALLQRGKAAAGADDAPTARRHWREAADLAVGLSTPEAAAVRELLRTD